MVTFGHAIRAYSGACANSQLVRNRQATANSCFKIVVDRLVKTLNSLSPPPCDAESTAADICPFDLYLCSNNFADLHLERVVSHDTAHAWHLLGVTDSC